MDETVVSGLKAFVTAAKLDSSIVHDEKISFFREYLESLGAKLPAKKSSPPELVRSVVDLAQFKQLLSSAGNTPILVDAYATWCPPCKVIAPIVEQLAAQYNGKVQFVKVDVDVAQDFASEYAISAMPTFKVFRNGKEVDSLTGADPSELKRLVEKAASGAAEEKPEPSQPRSQPQDAKMNVSDEEECEEDEEDEGTEEGALAGLEEDPLVLPLDKQDVNPEEVPMGSFDVELSDADMDKQISMKGEAQDLVSAGNLEAALKKFNEIIAIKASPLTLAKRADIFLKLKRPNAAIRDCDYALTANPDSAKSHKIRGKAYRLLGNWEEAAHSLQKGNAMDFDEDSYEVQKIVEQRWNRIREFRLKKEAKLRDKEVQKQAKARAKARAEAVRQYEEAKRREAEEARSGGTPRGFPGGMPGCTADCAPDCAPGFTPGCTPGEMPSEMPGDGSSGMSPDALEKLLASLDLPSDVKDKMKDPAVKTKLQKVFEELQSNPQAAPMTAMKHMQDPDVGPIISAVMKAMVGGSGMPSFGGGRGQGGMPGDASAGMPGGMSEEVD